MKVLKPLLGVVLSSVMALGVHAQQAAITLHGASQFGDARAISRFIVLDQHCLEHLSPPAAHLAPDF